MTVSGSDLEKGAGAVYVEWITVRRRCDVPMARKKGLLPCSHRCRTCLACIQINRLGEERHTPNFKKRESGDPGLLARNLLRGGFIDEDDD